MLSEPVYKNLSNSLVFLSLCLFVNTALVAWCHTWLKTLSKALRNMFVGHLNCDETMLHLFHFRVTFLFSSV